jgi:hypothetical protein
VARPGRNHARGGACGSGGGVGTLTLTAPGSRARLSLGQHAHARGRGVRARAAGEAPRQPRRVRVQAQPVQGGLLADLRPREGLRVSCRASGAGLKPYTSPTT